LSALDRPGLDARRDLFEAMLRIRLVEERIVQLYPEQEIRCPTHLCIGQEAPPVGVSAHLADSDIVFSAHRSHGHYLAKGGDLKAMLAELYGRATGCALGKGGSQHLVDLDAGFMGSAPILASTIAVGVGAAWGARMRGENRVVVIYFGDAAVEEGAFHEAVNFAAVQRLPVLFVCENNLYSVHTPLAVRQPAGRSIADLVRGHGISAEAGDGNDVEAVWRLAGAAVARARRGEGPSFLELATYRHLEHVGPHGDLQLGYRSAEEHASWLLRCPVATYRARLETEGTLAAGAADALSRRIGVWIDDAVGFAKSSPFPPAEMMMQHVYPG
jgi:TPP-dependent pyruvate/acetoin dehydrogenase alpha subunit